MIFLFHGVVSDDAPPERWRAGQAIPLSAFRKQIQWLSKHFTLLSAAEYLETSGDKRISARVASLTFDDGLAGTFELVHPVLEQENVPATIFVTTSHLDTPTLLWFSYLNALCFERVYEGVSVDGKEHSLRNVTDRRRTRRELGAKAHSSGSPTSYVRRLEERYPLPGSATTAYAGMTRSQLRTAAQSEHIEVGSHTVTHPFLSQLALSDQAEEIHESKRILTEHLKTPVRFFAYPAGDYSADTIKTVKEAGYEAAFAVIPRRVGSDGRFEMSRVGIYSTSLLKVKLKAYGVANVARTFGIKVG